MSLELQRAFYSLDLPTTVKFVGVTIAWHHNAKSQQCDPSVALLMEETGLSDRAISAAIKTLADAGHITVVRAAGKRSSYRLHPRTTFAPEPDSPPNDVRHTPERRSPLPPNDVRHTPERRSPELQRTAKPTTTEQQSFALLPADADAPQPKPTTTRKPQSETPADPRHRIVMTGISDAIRKATKHPAPLTNPVAVGAALKRLLAAAPDKTAQGILDDLTEAVRQSLDPDTKFEPMLRRAADPLQFFAHYGEIMAVVERRNGAFHRPDPNSPYGF